MMSRNKREGYYGGQWKNDGYFNYYGFFRYGNDPRKHQRIKHHPKPPGMKSVGQKLLMAIF